jgi:hypothetical protein
MYASVRALLSGIVDYAGLFPPAKLPMDEAVRNYLRYRTEPESWMLGRFICPAARLGELAAFAEDIAKLPAPLSLSLLGRGGGDAEEFLAGVRADIAEALKFRTQLGEQAVVETYEAKLPPGLCEPDAETRLLSLLDTVSLLWRTEWTDSPEGVTPFYEPPSASRETVHFVAGVLAQDAWKAAQRKRPRRHFTGLKLRCGGADPAQVPTADQLAFAITRSRDLLRVALKFTAGLHHPFPDFDNATRTMMHGFLSLFAAGALASDYPLAPGDTVEEVIARQIITDPDPRNFRFTDFELAWRGLSAPIVQVGMARQTLVTSFGSCSFDEPRDDLRALGLI